MDLGLREKVCIVTGSTSGIGLEVARQLREEGALTVTSGRRDGGIGDLHVVADLAQPDVDAWVEQMHAEGVAQSLVHIVPVAIPSDAVVANTLSQILQEAARASVLLSERRSTPWSALPMSRASCDGMVPCAYQSCCHAETVNIGEIGLYLPRKQEYPESVKLHHIAAVATGDHGSSESESLESH